MAQFMDDEHITGFFRQLQAAQEENPEALQVRRTEARQWFDALSETHQNAVNQGMGMMPVSGDILPTFDPQHADFIMYMQENIQANPRILDGLIADYEAYKAANLQKHIQLFQLLPADAQITAAATIADMSNGTYTTNIENMSSEPDRVLRENSPTRVRLQEEMAQGRSLESIITETVQTLQSMPEAEQYRAITVIGTTHVEMDMSAEQERIAQVQNEAVRDFLSLGEDTQREVAFALHPRGYLNREPHDRMVDIVVGDLERNRGGYGMDVMELYNDAQTIANALPRTQTPGGSARPEVGGRIEGQGHGA